MKYNRNYRERAAEKLKKTEKKVAKGARKASRRARKSLRELEEEMEDHDGPPRGTGAAVGGGLGALALGPLGAVGGALAGERLAHRNPKAQAIPLLESLAALRAAYLTYHTAHWQAQGKGYYGNHQLLQRLYEETFELSDEFGERAVGYYGNDSVAMGDQIQRISRWLEMWSDIEDPIDRSLEAARGLSDELADCYAKMKESGELSLGMDDLLMSTANDVDEHIYLLQQAARQ